MARQSKVVAARLRGVESRGVMVTERGRRPSQPSASNVGKPNDRGVRCGQAIAPSRPLRFQPHQIQIRHQGQVIRRLFG